MVEFAMASWDKVTLIVTIGATLLTFGVNLAVLPVRQETPFTFVLIMLLIWTPLLITWGLAPRSYVVTDQGILVNRVWGKITLPSDQVKSVTPLARVYPKIRIAASGGLFGYYGVFLVKEYGKVRLYATRMKDLVLIETAHKGKILISPAEPDNFIAAVKNKLTVNKS